MPRRKAAALLVAILVLSLAVRLLCFSGVGITDSCRYVLAAGNAGAGNYPWREDPAVYVRPGFVLPLVPLVWWGGYGLSTPVLYNLACSLCLMVVTYLIGQALFDRRAGLWAAAVLGASTLAVSNGTGVVPDTPQTLFCALSIALVLAATRVSGRPGVGGLCLAAGVALGVAWLTKCTSLFVIPVLLLVVLRMPHRRGLAVVCGVAGFVLILLGEMAFWASVSGYPWEMLRVLFAAGEEAAADATHAFFSLWEYPTKMFVVVSDDGLFYYLVVAAVLWSLVWARRPAAVPLVWLAVFFLFLQFGSMSFRVYSPFYHQPRYLMPLVPAGAVLAGAWLCAMARRHAWAAVGIYVVYAVPSLLLAYMGPAQSHTPMVAAKAAAEILASRRATEVYTDPTFALGMNYFRRNFPAKLPVAGKWLSDDLKPVVDPNAHPGAYVVRYDGTIQRRVADLALAGALGNRLYAPIERIAAKEVVPVRFGHAQRAVMAWLWGVLREAPLPEGISRRLGNAFSRHLAEPVLVIYRIAQPGERPGSGAAGGAGSTRPSASSGGD